MARKTINADEAREAIRRAQHMSDAPPAPTVFRGRKQRYFEARVALATVEEAAAIAGYSRSHAYKMELDDRMVNAIAEATADRVKIAQDSARGLVPLAVRRLGDILKDPLARDGDVISAAKELLDRGGVPKTERIEHGGEVQIGLDDVERLLDDVEAGAEVAQRLRLVGDRE